MDLIITDVTEMNGGNYCVAGWDIAANRMVRPLPNGGNWPTALLQQHGIVAGRQIQVTPQGASNGIFPHRTEDTPIEIASINAGNQIFSDWLGGLAPQVAADLNTGFGGHLRWNKEWNGVRQGVHVQPRTQCSSLVAVRIPKANLSFGEFKGTLKGTLNDGSSQYQFTVSSKILKEAWRTAGFVAVNNALPTRDEFHVRVGLARPYENPPDPPKCYAMLNGVL